jgi:hypothetical protein
MLLPAFLVRGGFGHTLSKLRTYKMPDRATGCERLRSREDRVGVDAVVPVKVRYRASLAEMLDASGRVRCPCTAPSQPRVAGYPSTTITMPACAQVGEECFDMRARVHETAFASAMGEGPSSM